MTLYHVLSLPVCSHDTALVWLEEQRERERVREEGRESEKGGGGREEKSVSSVGLA